MDNIGLNEGDRVFLQHNCLDLALDSQARNDIQTLLDRGVKVTYSPSDKYSRCRTVKEIPLMPPLIVGIIAAVVTVGLVIFFVRRRRHA